MRIGNSYISPAVTAAEPVGRRKPAGQAVENSADLIAMSRGIRSAEEAGSDNRIEQLAAAWRSGTYRPDPERIADKLLTWGFERGQESL